MKSWIKRIAEIKEKLAEQRGEGDLATLTYIQEAIDCYKSLNDQPKIIELEKKYEKLKTSQKFETIQQKIDVSKAVEIFRKFATNLCVKEESEGIINFLALDKDILPKVKDMEERAIKNAQENPLQYLVSAKIIDQLGHTSEHFETEEERQRRAILFQYDLYLKIDKQILINTILYTAIREEKITLLKLLDYMENHSWYGKTFLKNNISDEAHDFNWLSLIAPALQAYFCQMDSYISNPDFELDFILPIDSLTLKVEGLIRDLCVFNKGTPFYHNQR